VFLLRIAERPSDVKTFSKHQIWRGLPQNIGQEQEGTGSCVASDVPSCFAFDFRFFSLARSYFDLIEN
jgi:hypothetical protein